MKKSMIILVLCALQGACAQHRHEAPGTQSLLSYAELGGAITVTRISLEEPAPDPIDTEEIVAAAP